MYSLYVDPSWRKKEIIPKRQQENFALAGHFLRSVQFLRRSEISRHREIFYLVYNFYVYTSCRQEEIIPKYQLDNFAPVRQFLRSIKFLRRFELAPKELIPRCRWESFAPTEFEIQIGV